MYEGEQAFCKQLLFWLQFCMPAIYLILYFGFYKWGGYHQQIDNQDILDLYKED